MRIIVHHPTGEEGREELARRVAQLHGDAALEYVKKLSCPREQKTALIDGVIGDKQRELPNRERSRSKSPQG